MLANCCRGYDVWNKPLRMLPCPTMCTLQTLVVQAFDTTQRLKQMLQGAGLLVPNMLPCKLIQVGKAAWNAGA